MTGKTVSIVGAGPAGLTSACQPALEGFDESAFEALNIKNSAEYRQQVCPEGDL